MTVWLTIQRDRIRLDADFFTGSLKGIAPGAYFGKTGGAHWTFPLELDVCHALRERFDQDLRIGADLSAWYRRERARRDTLGSLAGAKDAELVRVPTEAPALYAAMEARKFQKVAARYAADAGAFLLGDDPGLGKTLEAMAAVIERGEPGPYLVIAWPKTAVEAVWAREIPRWLPEHRAYTLPEGRAKRDAMLDGIVKLARMNKEDRTAGREPLLTLSKAWVIVHPEALLTKRFWVCTVCGERTTYTRKPTYLLDCEHEKGNTKVTDAPTFSQLMDIEWGAIIVDESHESLISRSGTPTQRRNGLDLVQVRENGLRIAMSGTPWKGKPFQLWGTLNWLSPKVYSGKWRWIQKYWETGGYTGYEIGKMKSDMEEALWDSLKPMYLRRSKAEVADDMPAKTYVGTPWDPSRFDSPVGVWLPMTKEQERLYRTMEKESAVALTGGRLDAIGVLAEQTRLKQFATSCGRMDGDEFIPALPSNKFDYMMGLLESLGAPDPLTTKVLVASEFTKVLKVFEEELRRRMPKLQTGLLIGGMGKRAAEMVADVNRTDADSIQVLFVQMKTGGAAITIDTADHTIMLDEGDPDTMTQMEDRTHRLSKPRPVFYHYLRSMETINVGTALVNAEWAAEGRRLADERRGVSYLRAVLEASNG